LGQGVHRRDFLICGKVGHGVPIVARTARVVPVMVSSTTSGNTIKRTWFMSTPCFLVRLMRELGKARLYSRIASLQYSNARQFQTESIGLELPRPLVGLGWNSVGD
jgi:hypothetical protein